MDVGKPLLDEPQEPDPSEEVDCFDCNGQGWTVVAGHARDQECYEGHHTNCPVQEQEQCDTCGGTGTLR